MFGYPCVSAAALLAGVLPLRYCSARFACKLPTWRLPDRGHVCELVTDGVVGARVLGGDGICRVSLPRSAVRAGVSCERRVLGGFKRIRLSRKTPAHLARLGNLGSVASRSRVWKRLRVSDLRLVGVLFVALMFCMSVIIVMMGLHWMIGLGSGRFLGLHWPTSPGFARRV